MFLRLMLSLLPVLFLDTDPSPGNPPKNDPPKNDPPKVTFSEEQQAELNEIVARETQKAADKARADLEAEQADAKAKADADAKRKADEEKGEFDKVKTSLEGERDTAVSERDTLKGENDALASYFTAQYEVALKDLPDVIKAFAPAEDATFEQKSDWLTKAQEQAKGFEKPVVRGHGPNPKVTTATIDIDKETARKARAYRI